MKNLVLIIALLVAAALARAGGLDENTSYVKADGRTYFGNELKTGLFNVRITTSDGTEVKIANRRVESYMHDGRLFEKLPVTCPGSKTAMLVMQEYVASRNGLRLYKSSSYQPDYESQSGYPGCMISCNTCYFVYSDGRFYLKVDQNNAGSVLPFFGLQFIEN